MSRQKLRSRQKLMSSLSQYLRKNKGEVATKSSVVKEIEVATEHLGCDKSNSFKRLIRSRQLNNVMRCLMSQPDVTGC